MINNKKKIVISNSNIITEQNRTPFKGTNSITQPIYVVASKVINSNSSAFIINYRLLLIGTRYRRVENGVAHCDHSHTCLTCLPNLVNFGPQTAKMGPFFNPLKINFSGRSYQLPQNNKNQKYKHERIR